ncbi:glycosyltransferase family 2 protein [Paractinoplanes lichenicola]|uniref:Glycosyltransferase family 2 protein n=1 Tax=Paractinoplanes lichenicola TaxID=2802976 RepID=A0ABS1VGH8_9ACTN|nr:glycosyltransferase family 2 protein [Actinoplanes lichenicola]MBL7253773.1 glycosyltransferase family 2 protein [Actinoplanes lichenicola]
MVLLLPVYQPSPDRLRALAAEFEQVVVVDDGSSEPVSVPGCVVLRHPVNRGKGAALKTGFAYVAQAYPGEPVICADADGQHSAADIRRVLAAVEATDRLVLGVRRVRRMPARSRIGNAVTRSVFRAATGRWVRDTQTGLRGVPGGLLEWLGEVPGERFEYEMNVLLRAARDGHPIEQVPVETTYLDGNASSHFGSVRDAVRVYRSLLRFVVLDR